LRDLEIIKAALAEDVGSGDITAQLIPEDKMVAATILCRDNAVICGVDYVNAVFYEVDHNIKINWHCEDGDKVKPNTTLCEINGNARSILTAERTALNFLQTLSATATTTNLYAEKIKHTKAKILDTRKTIPGLRAAQKYAVLCGGGENHRFGLFDAFLIKENHIMACGSIKAAVDASQKISNAKFTEVEVENLTEFDEALAAGVDRIMLDNFTHENTEKAVKKNHGKAMLEYSGNVNLDNIQAVAETGVDYISIGALTKHINAIDLSLRFLF